MFCTGTTNKILFYRSRKSHNAARAAARFAGMERVSVISAPLLSPTPTVSPPPSSPQPPSFLSSPQLQSQAPRSNVPLPARPTLYVPTVPPTPLVVAPVVGGPAPQSQMPLVQQYPLAGWQSPSLMSGPLQRGRAPAPDLFSIASSTAPLLPPPAADEGPLLKGPPQPLVSEL